MRVVDDDRKHDVLLVPVDASYPLDVAKPDDDLGEMGEATKSVANELDPIHWLPEAHDRVRYGPPSSTLGDDKLVHIPKLALHQV